MKKNDKGVTLISLTIAVMIILLITGVLIYKATDSIGIRNLTNLYNDISNIRDKITAYYEEYGTLPKAGEYTNTQGLDDAGVLGANDTGKFYVVDLQELDGLTLNYGKDYEKVKSGSASNVNELTDLYIVNENSNNIFYVKGIEIEQNNTTKTYYTDEENPDRETLILHNGFEAQPGVIVEGDNKTYTDKYGNKVTIPVGFKVSEKEDEQTVPTGLVIADADGNEFVWIPCSEDGETYNINEKRDTKTEELSRRTFTEDGATKVIGDNVISTNNYGEGNENSCLYQYAQKVYEDDYKYSINYFKDSVNTYGGFFIARYEASKNGDNVQSKANQTPSTNMTKDIALQDSIKMYKDSTSVVSSLANSYSWDTMVDFVCQNNEQGYVMTSWKDAKYGNIATGQIKNTAIYTYNGNTVDKYCNIYDLLGNVSEFTTEYVKSQYPSTIRGGTFDTEHLIGLAGRNNTGISYSWLGFRPIIYLQFERTTEAGNRVEDANKIYTDTDGDKTVIPKEFTVSGIQSEQNISDGLVIYDIPDGEVVNWEDDTDGNGVPDVQQKYNQFVWVPVPNDADFKTYEGYSNKALQKTLSVCEEPYSKGYSTEKDEYEDMKRSVLNHNGFYVARYEAGTENGERKKDENIEDEVVSKRGTNVYNYIKWGNSIADEMGGAVEKAKEMYTDRNEYNVTSTLIYGAQWDSIMAWIDSAYKTGTCNTSTSFVANSEWKGYYSQSSPTTTGSNNNYEVKGIFDLAGNVAEWSMEENGGVRSVRGGSFYRTGVAFPASERDSSVPSDNSDNVAFRVALYL